METEARFSHIIGLVSSLIPSLKNYQYSIINQILIDLLIIKKINFNNISKFILLSPKPLDLKLISISLIFNLFFDEYIKSAKILYPCLYRCFLFDLYIFFLKIKYPLIGSVVFFPRKKLIINIKIIEDIYLINPNPLLPFLLDFCYQ